MKKIIRFLVPFLMAALVITSIFWYLFVYDREFTRDMLLKQARYHDLHGNSRISSMFYNLAYQQSGQDQNVAIELANQYIEDGNYTKAEVTLTNAVNGGPTVELYTALCKVYVEQDKLLDAVSLLASVKDPYIKAELEDLRPVAPTADHEAGFYSQYIHVALSVPSGTIYSTSNGDYPSIADMPYAEPIALSIGETQIYAIAVADSGLVSPITVLGYTVGGVVEPAVFTDPAIELAVHEILNVDSSKTVYTNQLWNITEFTVPADAAQLDDLALFTHLESLTATGMNLNSLSPLSTLSKLRRLDLSGSKLPSGDLSILAGLPELTELSLANCGLSTIADLNGAKAMQKLDLSSNTIRNLEPISGMTEMTELNLQHNALITLDALSTLEKLDTLDVSFNALTSLAPIAGCIKLTKLNAGNNQLELVDGVTELPLLNSLTLDYNKLTDVTPLGKCLGLTELRISNNSITSIAALASLIDLDILDFSYNSVEALPAWPEGTALRLVDGSYNSLRSIDVLKDMENITYVYMDYNSLTNVDALAKCYHLVQVNVYGNDIKDVSALTAHNILVNYNPTN